MAKIFKSNAFYRSLNTFFYFFFKLKKYYYTHNSIFEFSNMCTPFHPHTLYTQLCRITLVAQVLPRLLAPVFATTSFSTYQHNSRVWSNFTAAIAFLVPVKLIGHTCVHCLIFFTAAIRWGSFHTPCG